jgi:hypothetical protein
MKGWFQKIEKPIQVVAPVMTAIFSLQFAQWLRNLLEPSQKNQSVQYKNTLIAPRQ